MKRIPICICFSIVSFFSLDSRNSLAQGRFPDAHDRPPRNWDQNDPIFQLSQKYPPNRPAESPMPWDGIDFEKDSERYLEKVLDYVKDGNVSHDWRAENNPARPWYHAPWMHWGDKGREFIRGMTRERRSRPCELSDQQHEAVQNWAVSVYNDRGGYVLGQVWANPAAPNPAAARFPLGTVAVKLLFTEATETQVSFLKDSPEWTVNILSWNEPGVRRSKLMRLLQIDVAVRDKRADPWTGWVFGTFQYDAGIKESDPWKRIVPIGLTWGNDINPKAQFWINPKAAFVKYRRSLGKDLGWQGRLNGPVDNPNSSCLSCHSTAQHPVFADLFPPAGADKALWFRNLKPDEAFSKIFDKPAQSLDYSLQLAAGIQNFYEWVSMIQGLGAKGELEIASTPIDKVDVCPKSPIEAAVHQEVFQRRVETAMGDSSIHEFRVDRDEDGVQLMPSHEALSPP